MIACIITRIAVALLILGGAAHNAMAATVNSCAEIPAALLLGSVTTGPITCDSVVVLRNIRQAGVTLDATGATFRDGIIITGSTGVTIKGGTYGTVLRPTSQRYAIMGSALSDVSIAGVTTLAPYGSDRGGVQVRNSNRVTIRDSVFVGHSTGLAVLESTDFLILRNEIGPRKDGMNIAGSRNGVVAGNSVHVGKRQGVDHPDGIQLWSLPGQPLQSDMWFIGNYITGDAQGIFSTDPKVVPSAERLHFLDNVVAVTFSHTITCSNCPGTEARGNVLASYPGSYFGIGSLKLGGSDTAAERNTKVDGTVTLPPMITWNGVIPIEVGSRFDRVQP